jgi:hypothetical protein
MENSKLYDFLKSKNITESSLKLYLNNLRRLNGGEFPKNFSFLKNVDGILEKLNQYKPNTRRSYLIAIVTTLKHEPKLKKLYSTYYEHLEKYNKEGAKNNEKSDTQKQNWINQSEVKEIYDNITSSVKPLLERKKAKRPTQAEYDKLLQWVTLSLYILQKPRRNADYQHCLIVNTMPTGELPQSTNFLNLSNGKWYFNNYKTKGTYKTQEIDATPEMLDVIKSYLKYHPLGKTLKKKSGQIPLLVDYEGNPFTSINAITRILNKVFGKRIGASMLRNIYLTDKYSDQMKEIQQDAEMMGTSTNTIQSQYIKTDGDNVIVGDK